MKTPAFVALLGAVLAVSPLSTARAADWIYATVDFGTGCDLIRIDLATGTITDIGTCTVTGQPGHEPGITGLSWHTDGLLYAFDTYGNQVITIDTTTAVGTLVTGVGEDLGRRAEAEVQAQLALRQEAVVAHDVAHLHLPAHRDPHPGADAVPVAAAAHRRHRQPVAAVAALVAQQ